jgi:hypothetical protein
VVEWKKNTKVALGASDKKNIRIGSGLKSTPWSEL